MTVDGDQEHAPRWQWALCWVGCLAGLVVAVIVLRLGLRAHTQPPDVNSVTSIEDPSMIGTIARISVNGRAIENRLPRMDWSIEPGGRIGSETVNGPLEAVFNVTFVAGAVHMAYLGVEVQGGSVILLRDGHVLLSTYSDQRPVTRMTTTPESFGPHQQHIELQFKGDGTGPMQVRALWRPVDADQETLLPSESAVTRN